MVAFCLDHTLTLASDRDRVFSPLKLRIFYRHACLGSQVLLYSVQNTYRRLVKILCFSGLITWAHGNDLINSYTRHQPEINTGIIFFINGLQNTGAVGNRAINRSTENKINFVRTKNTKRQEKRRMNSIIIVGHS